jgi:hypothetical protein
MTSSTLHGLIVGIPKPPEFLMASNVPVKTFSSTPSPVNGRMLADLHPLTNASE